MDIFRFAMEKEKYSEDYYRRLAAKTTSQGLQNIFTMLADEEAKHYKIVQQMRNQMPSKIAGAAVLADAKRTFAKMRQSVEKFNFSISELELYKKACDMEEQSKKFYLEKADEVGDELQKNIFLMLAEEENKHLILLENIVEFVSRPQTWLENAEFFHMEEY